MKYLLTALILCSHVVALSAATPYPVVPTKSLTISAPSENTAAKPPSSIDKDSLLSAIEVTGNVLISTDAIIQKAELKVGGTLTPPIISRTLKNVKSLGYFSDVTSEVVKTKDGQKLVLIVKENPVLSRIEFAGNTSFSQSDLENILLTKSGELLSLENVRIDVRTIENAYHSNGYRQTRVVGVSLPEKSTEPLIFNISEGIIDAIIITGNTRTKDYVILREMDLMPGSALNEEKLKRDLRAIYNLNYFSELEPQLVPGLTPNSVILQIRVVEKSSGSLNVGGGFSDKNGLFGFTDIYLDNLFGTGQLLGLKTKFGNASSYEFKYYNPWMWEKKKSFTFKAWYRTGGSESFSPTIGTSGSILFKNQVRTGVELSVGLPINRELRIEHTLKNESVQVLDAPIDQYNIRSYAINIAYDTRDVWFNPKQGDYHSINIEKAFNISGSLDFTKIDTSVRKFFQMTDNQVFAARLDIGQQLGDIKQTEVYTIGGMSTVRGYPDLAPVSYGRTRVFTNLEYRFLFTDSFQFILFVDAGYATSASLNSKASIFNPGNYIIGKGVGIRVTTPLGPLRLDFGNSDQGNWQIHFSMGQSF